MVKSVRAATSPMRILYTLVLERKCSYNTTGRCTISGGFILRATSSTKHNRVHLHTSHIKGFGHCSVKKSRLPKCFYFYVAVVRFRTTLSFPVISVNPLLDQVTQGGRRR